MTTNATPNTASAADAAAQADMNFWLNQCHLGDCLDVLRAMPDNCVDAIVTDPPYGLSFMGKKWDYDVPDVAVWVEALRVLKPGGHLLAFAGTRTQHRMACRIEDAGFEIRDMIAWVYGSGFPKSLDVSKAIDKAAGAEREVTGTRTKAGIGGSQTFAQDVWTQANRGEIELDITAPSTESAKQWQGWGTALKPALEPITLARKPFACTVAANVLQHGAGALNVDGCRVDYEDTKDPATNPLYRQQNGYANANAADDRSSSYMPKDGSGERNPNGLGRWPANLIHDGSAEVLAEFPQSAGQQGDVRGTESSHTGDDNTNCYGEYGRIPTAARNDFGSAARFFYCAKASSEDRNEGMYNATSVQQDPTRKAGDPGGDNPRNRGAQARKNHHPTVKPTDLMRYLCRLVTPKGGIVLDPFMGSGSTGRAAVLEGFQYIGIERDADYIAIARARIDSARRQGHQPAFDFT